MSHAFAFRISRNLLRSLWMITTSKQSQGRGDIVVKRNSPTLLQFDGSRMLQVRWKGGYSDFGHNPKSTSLFTVLWTGFLVSVMIGIFIDWKVLWEIFQEKVKPPKVDADEVSNHN